MAFGQAFGEYNMKCKHLYTDPSVNIIIVLQWVTELWKGTSLVTHF